MYKDWRKAIQDQVDPELLTVTIHISRPSGRVIYLGRAKHAAKLSVSGTVKDPIRASFCSTNEFICRNNIKEMAVPLTLKLPFDLAEEATSL